ncbi:U4/U6 X U5 tri-snRNP complex subunit Prp4 family protein [Schizosaccharomyces octosporus yFS286]|uniref:U4/U6 X U5 tri-snRNP complex subunit Prp4 family protein n=1 Tax=Schizosaccharomyces octosporus (strain yFS286) TaxID=483514 RepID=S9Q4J1_SCHOY|nr:U4/U6 X U5 tri-snRNP complex subunit Prp4 family protein [Schizosaccharomyces octosporus yFS286]EPX74997.1 U4/U6 X U5 tri-snRNP complex subunit Prp4 family protein [Schizosaccharomyces octosporus yFS286]
MSTNSGGIYLQDLETRQVPEGITRSSKEQAAYYAEKEREERIRALRVPYEDGRVRELLRGFGEPVTYFAEDAGSRRERLLNWMLERSYEGQQDIIMDAVQGDEADEDEDHETYSEGSQELLEARRRIALYSLEKAKLRLEIERKEFEIPVPEKIISARFAADHYRKVDAQGSQVGGERPMSIIRFCQDGNKFATGSWSGQVKVWDTKDLSQVRLYRGHTDKVSGLDWHPGCVTWDEMSENVCFATGAADNSVCLWNGKQSTPISRLDGHLARVLRVAFHPSGDYLASGSFDTTWRLWDVATETELLMQEGHAEGIFSVAWQPDGSLLSSGGMDAIGRVWDVRSGKSIMVLDDHIRHIVSMDWAPNGYQLATASADDTIKLWDLRNVSISQTIPAHTSLVSEVRYLQSENAVLLLSSGYDGCVKIWNPTTGALVKNLVGHEEKVMSVDGHGDRLLSSGFDRTIKLWHP